MLNILVVLGKKLICMRTEHMAAVNIVAKILVKKAAIEKGGKEAGGQRTSPKQTSGHKAKRVGARQH